MLKSATRIPQRSPRPALNPDAAAVIDLFPYQFKKIQHTLICNTTFASHTASHASRLTSSVQHDVVTLHYNARRLFPCGWNAAHSAMSSRAESTGRFRSRRDREAKKAKAEESSRRRSERSLSGGMRSSGHSIMQPINIRRWQDGQTKGMPGTKAERARRAVDGIQGDGRTKTAARC